MKILDQFSAQNDKGHQIYKYNKHAPINCGKSHMDEKFSPIFDLINDLKNIEKSFIDAGKGYIFLEIRKDIDGSSVIINGNREGLVHLARLTLEISAKNFSGAHKHFDTVGELDFCEVPLTIALKPADWDYGDM